MGGSLEKCGPCLLYSVSVPMHIYVTFRGWGRPAHKRISINNSSYFHRISAHRRMKYVITNLLLHCLLNCLSAILAPIESYWPQATTQRQA